MNKERRTLRHYVMCKKERKKERKKDRLFSQTRHIQPFRIYYIIIEYAHKDTRNQITILNWSVRAPILQL
jgi:hypothetical protein